MVLKQKKQITIKKQITMDIKKTVIFKNNLIYKIYSYVLGLILLLLFSNCVSTKITNNLQETPFWWNNPKRDNRICLYTKASSVNCKTEEEARQQAYNAALSYFNKRISSEVITIEGTDGNSYQITAKHNIKKTKIEFGKVVQVG